MAGSHRGPMMHGMDGRMVSVPSPMQSAPLPCSTLGMLLLLPLAPLLPLLPLSAARRRSLNNLNNSVKNFALVTAAILQ